MKGMATDEDAEILRLMREAIHKSRGYASYWEWKLDKQQPELHADELIFPDRCPIFELHRNNFRDRQHQGIITQ